MARKVYFVNMNRENVSFFVRLGIKNAFCFAENGGYRYHREYF